MLKRQIPALWLLESKQTLGHLKIPRYRHLNDRYPILLRELFVWPPVIALGSLNSERAAKIDSIYCKTITSPTPASLPLFRRSEDATSSPQKLRLPHLKPETNIEVLPVSWLKISCEVVRSHANSNQGKALFSKNLITPPPPPPPPPLTHTKTMCYLLKQNKSLQFLIVLRKFNSRNKRFSRFI